MKTQFKNPINKFAPLFLMLVTMFLLGFGCNTSKPTPDPLVGFQRDFEFDPYSNNKSDKAIYADVQDYMKQEKIAGPVMAYKDGTGQHAINIHVGINGTSWEYVLFYDKNDKRIKVIKYADGHYAC